jgi:Rha family phage regulatory protein
MATSILPENVSYANAINTAMTNIVQGAITMTSREIAEITGKQHKNVLRDIDNILETLSSEMSAGFKSSTYVDSSGKSNRQFVLDRDSSYCLVSGYDVNARMRIIKRWQELESKQSSQHSPTPQPVPQIPIIELQERRVNLCERVLNIAKAFDDDMLQIMALDNIKNALLLSSGASNGTDVVSEFQTAEVLESLGMNTLEIRSRRAYSGKLLSSAFRSEFGKEPKKTKRMIDGAMRDVNLYPTSWFDTAKEIISQYYNKQPMVA